jgi:hypothetical protein
MLRNTILMWHKIRARYHEILIQDCLDESLKQMLTNKLKYHRSHLNNALIKD